MAVSRITPPAVTPVVEEKSNLPKTDQDDQHRSSLTTSQQPSGSNTSGRKYPNAERDKLLANSARGRVRKAPASSPKESTGAAWNKGLAFACDLVQALVSSQDGADKPAGFSLREFNEMIRPLATQAQASTAADFFADAIKRLQTSGLPGQNEALGQALEALRADKEDVSVLGFYAVMAVMAEAVGIAELIGTNEVNDACAKVTTQVRYFARHIASLLERTSPAESPQAAKLIAMARAAMKVPFEYLPGKGMPLSLSHSMMKWRPALGAETETAQDQLENALRSFIDARTGKRK